MSPDPLRWDDWTAAPETLTDRVTLASLERMSATLDRADPPWQTGDPVPPLWHLMYFPAVAPRSTLGPDGHPERGGFLPPIALQRRMFAGARTVFHRPLRAGEAIRREGEVASIEPKEGRSGALVVVLVRFHIHGEDGLALEEELDLIYRDGAAPARTRTKSDPAIAAPDWRRTITPDPVTLFRYSALTFNGHRIHYDRTYAMEEEGYPGLVVHGPLIATYLAELCRDNTDDRPLARFGFRARRPLFDTAPFEVTGVMDPDGRGCHLEALDPDGAVAMTAEASFADG
ncbi:MAG: MaoC family dehydratase N-terminal domain-containing protein [Alphaproteobacteria bacterium]|nr:MaoC family dehydratase N-terminal domain-containing protein [Alphaproteobacteria bacterium]